MNKNDGKYLTSPDALVMFFGDALKQDSPDYHTACAELLQHGFNLGEIFMLEIANRMDGLEGIRAVWADVCDPEIDVRQLRALHVKYTLNQNSAKNATTLAPR